MQKRIRKVLLICSNYDAFMLEEDGRVDEQIFNEYVSLNLRYPPVFMHANTEEKAIEILTTDNIDLVIEMMGQGETDVFKLAKRLKHKAPNIPIVLLTHFTREVSLRIENANIKYVDYVFSWLGNSDLLLAIIKLIEDKMNALFDINEIGVQCILLIEDSIRYISTYLPEIYRFIFEQSMDYTTEALNEHQKMLRKRGRPKILLASNFEDACQLFEQYKNNLLGVISDVTFQRSANSNSEKFKGGLEIASLIKLSDEHIPFVIQSSELSNEMEAKKLNALFLHKQSPKLVEELRETLMNNFGFGDFIFRDPDTNKEIERACDLKTMQNLMLEVPDKVFYYHASHDHFSRWLKARALFPIARLLKDINIDDFEDLNQCRRFNFNTISRFRATKSRGIIAEFSVEQFDELSLFSRIGNGSIGGKARGLAFLDSVLKENNLGNAFKGSGISIPRTLAIGTDAFDDFIEKNNLLDFALECDDDSMILERFLQADLSNDIEEGVQLFISTTDKPIAVRSSSKLEDSYYQSFAGVYNTYMIDQADATEKTLTNICRAIKSIYASVFFKSSKSYILSTSNMIDEEKMGVLLQEVCGSWKGGYYYPLISGVARSINFYPLEGEKAGDGFVSLAVGLGKYIVDGGLALHFNPVSPKNPIQLSSTGQMIKSTQKKFFAICKNETYFHPDEYSIHNQTELRISELENTPGLHLVASTLDLQNEMVIDSVFMKGKRIITFANLLKHELYPLPEIIRKILDIGRKEMNNHVEIEFAVDYRTDSEKIHFNLLQIRPVNRLEKSSQCVIETKDKEKAFMYTTSTLGNGSYTNVDFIVYVKPENFNPSKNPELALQIDTINDDIKKSGKNYLLIGPGRWGSVDPWLGIPVSWSCVSEAKVIAEYHLENYFVEPSQGSHFFHNLIQFGVGYLTIGNSSDHKIEHNWLKKKKAKLEDEFIKVILLEKPLKICIDGRKNKGIVYKEEI